MNEKLPGKRKTTTGNGGFKLLAIRPLHGCDENFRKRLKEGCIYKFYQNYRFLDENSIEILEKNENLHNPVHKVIRPDKLNLYTRKKLLEVNISAIVGKNGSGKSSLFELFFLVLFLKSAETGLLDLEAERKKALAQIGQLVTDISIDHANIESLLEKNDKIEDDRKELIRLILNKKNLERELSWERHHLSAIGDAQKLAKEHSAAIAIYFDVNGNVRKLCTGSTDDTPIKSIELTKSNIKDFFYSISLNYSLYGLNAKYLGRWVERLFHKNDAYHTPIVINPMRSDGDIDINKENDLAQSRILTNLVDEKLKQKEIVKGKVIDQVQFSIPTRKLDDNEYYLSKGDNIFTPSHKISEVPELKLVKIRKEQIDHNDLRSPDDDILTLFGINEASIESNGMDLELIRKYISQKLFKIARTYNEYRKYLQIYDSNKQAIYNVKDFVKDIIEDQTHKSLKIRQLINVLKFGILSNRSNDDMKSMTGNPSAKAVKWNDDRFKLDFKDYAKIINEAFRRARAKSSNHKLELLEFVPNGYFIPQVRFKGEDRFESLSSGEQQYYNAINTIVYHTLNLDSIDDHYSRVNVMFDEVELYFHPEFQRRFISDLLRSLNNLKLDKIREVNVLFSTHSPFILSDIPSSNILRLVDGAPQEQTNQTFAANIYDLLNDDFFLKDGVIGEFAKKKINRILRKKEISQNEMDIIELIGDPFLKSVVLDKVMSNKYEKNEEMIRNQIKILEDQLTKKKKDGAD